MLKLIEFLGRLVVRGAWLSSRCDYGTTGRKEDC